MRPSTDDPRAVVGIVIGGYFLSHFYDMVVRGDSDPAAVADALDISLGRVYAALAYRVVEPPAAADAVDE